MKGSIAAFLRTARGRLIGSSHRRIWSATTRTGKTVVIDGDRVVKVIDPRHGQKGGYVR